MKAEEKAKQLIKRFFILIPQPYRTNEIKGTEFEGLKFNDWDKNWTTDMVKKCASSCVDEIIDCCKTYINTSQWKQDAEIDYWIRVKKHINKN